jgi:hypothetical protein
MINKIFTFGLVAIGLAVLAYGYLKPEPKDEQSTVHDVFPAVENADGTIDYTLADRTSLEFLGYYWIVRLPKDQYAEESKPGTDRVGIVNGAEVGLNTYSNQYLRLFIKWPSKQPFPANATIEEISRESHLSLSLFGQHHEREFAGRYFLTDTAKTCASKGEVYKNLHEYLSFPKEVDGCR